MAAFMPPQAQILSDMVLANNHFTNEWPTAGCSSCLSGNHASSHLDPRNLFRGRPGVISDQPRHQHLQLRRAVGRVHQLEHCGTGDTDTSPDDQCAGQEYVELYQFDTTQTNRLTHIANNVNYWMSHNTGIEPDDLRGFHPHVHARVCQARRAEFQCHQRAQDQCHLFADDVHQLPFHQKRLWPRPTAFTTPPTISGGGTQLSCPNYTASDGTKQKCYWSRGNGWAFVALARTMDVLPTNDPHYAEYLQTFQEMAAAIKAVQRADGFWNVNLAYTNDYPGPESSGTACFTYGFAWGINHGYLDTNTYLPAVIAGWNALAVGALHHSTGADNGFLGYEQGSGSKPSDSQPVTYTSVPNFDDFGLGLFLLAGSQVYQLSGPPGIALAAPVLTGNKVQLNFTVISTLTNATLNLLQTSQLGTGWTTNTTATLTNYSGISYGFTATNNGAARFYQIQIAPQ